MGRKIDKSRLVPDFEDGEKVVHKLTGEIGLVSGDSPQVFQNVEVEVEGYKRPQKWDKDYLLSYGDHHDAVIESVSNLIELVESLDDLNHVLNDLDEDSDIAEILRLIREE